MIFKLVDLLTSVHVQIKETDCNSYCFGRSEKTPGPK